MLYNLITLNAHNPRPSPKAPFWKCMSACGLSGHTVVDGGAGLRGHVLPRIGCACLPSSLAGKGGPPSPEGLGALV